jgi:hypothetical protein
LGAVLAVGVADTGFPHFVQNLAPSFSSAPHLVHVAIIYCCFSYLVFSFNFKQHTLKNSSQHIEKVLL